MLQQEGLLCFICGKYFGQELLSHQSECQKLRDQTITKAQQYLQYFENKEFEQRMTENQLEGPAMEPPTDLSDTDLVGKYNDEAGECFSKALIPCIKCNRHFHFDRLELHLRNCNGIYNLNHKNDSSPLHNKKHKEESNEKKSPRKVRFVTCYLCGKNASLDTIEIHHHKCLEQRGLNYSKHPEHIHKLYEGPKPPSLHVPTRDDEDDFFEKYNQQALVVFYKSPVPCSICGRNFHQRSLEQHMKSCRPRSSPTIAPHEVDSNHSGRRTAPTTIASRKEHKVVAAPEGTLQVDNSKHAAGSLETEEAPKPVTKAASSLSLLKLKRKKRNQAQEGHIELNHNHSTHQSQYHAPTSPRQTKLQKHQTPHLKPALSPTSKIPMLQYRNGAFHSFPKDRVRNEILIPKSQLAQVRTLENWESNDNSTAMDNDEGEHAQETTEVEQSHEVELATEVEQIPEVDISHFDELPQQLDKPSSPKEITSLELQQSATEDPTQGTEVKDDSEEEFVVNHVVHDNLQTSVESIEEDPPQALEEMDPNYDSEAEDAQKEKHHMDVDVTETLVRLPTEPIYVHEEGGTKLPRITHSPSKPTPRRFEVNHAINGIPPTSSLGAESLKNFREKSPNPLTEHADRVLRKLEQERGGTPQSMVRFCTHCGLKFPGEGPAFRFCGSCGFPRKWK